MTENTRETCVQEFIIFDGQMFGDNSSIPFHFGKSGGNLTIRGVEEINAASTGEENGREIRFTLPLGGSVLLSNDSGQRGFMPSTGEMSLTVKAAKMLIVG
ncbi:hypothetical protein MK805_05835 [Shimazuella sp. AN120528]|uniref:hypothetical protein n=1 Tax=Shimazuella soli TaxID=1892854 RepID=UPI001F1145AF|nr:hypothetical protein [Shimazuella soli]MCH5584488.1 hypothetical protein [Shimazuella soli]